MNKAFIKIWIDRRTAIDENCLCGHPRSSHSIADVQFRGINVDVPGKGPCLHSRCLCMGFRFEGWIFADES